MGKTVSFLWALPQSLASAGFYSLELCMVYYAGLCLRYKILAAPRYLTTVSWCRLLVARLSDLCKDHCLISLLYSRRFHSILQQVFDGCKLAKISTLLCGWHCPIHRVEPAVFREAYFCACLVVFLDLVRRVVVWVNKKLSYRRGTARRATLVNSCCFASYGSYKGFKQQM